MPRSLLKPALAFALVALLALAAILWRPVWHVVAVARLKSAAGCREVKTHYVPPTGNLLKRVDAVVTSLCYGIDRAREFSSGSNHPGYAYEQYGGVITGTAAYMALEQPARFPPAAGDALSAFTQLRGLNLLHHAPVPSLPDADIERYCETIRSLPVLEHVTMNTDMLTDEAFARLRAHPNLRFLHLRLGRMTPDGFIDTLATFPALQSLSIETGSGASDRRKLCEALRTFTRLGSLRLYGDFTDADLTLLAGHPGITNLIVVSNHTTASCASALATMPRLRSVFLDRPTRSLRKGGFAPEDQAAVSAALPGVKVTMP